MGGGHIVPAADSFVYCWSIRDLEKVNFQRIPKIYQGFWIKKISKILYLEGSGLFVRTFSEI